MEKNRSSQLELFSQGREAIIKDSQPADGFLARIHNYEKVILGIIAFIISGAIFFCFGVEKGRSISRANIFKRSDVVSRPFLPLKPQETLKPATFENTVPARQPMIKKEAPVAPLKSRPAESYTVQVASYKNNIAAQKEAQRLRKSGLMSLVLVKGAYSIVCIGNFTGKNKAQEALLKLKDKYLYQDCLLRRL